jgi:hypothetical protein
MRLGFTLTFEEFREADAWTTAGGKPPTFSSRWAAPIGFAVVTVIALAALFLTPPDADWRNGLGQRRIFWYDILPSAVPAFALASYLLIVRAIAAAKPRADGGRKTWPRVALMVWATTITLLACVSYTAMTDAGMAVWWRPDARDLLLAIGGPWVAFTALLCVTAFVRQFTAQRSAWARQPVLQLPRTAKVEPEGIRITAGTDVSFYYWSRFTHVRETPGLFLLYLNEVQFVMVPKRAFTGATDEAQFRGLLANEVRDAKLQTPPPAFPITPANTDDDNWVSLT